MDWNQIVGQWKEVGRKAKPRWDKFSDEESRDPPRSIRLARKPADGTPKDAVAWGPTGGAGRASGPRKGSGRAKGSAGKAAPARNVPCGPTTSQRAPAITLATSSASPVIRFNIPKAVPRNSGGAVSATRVASNP